MRSMPVRIDVNVVWSEIRGGDFIPWKEISEACSYFLAGSIYSKYYISGRWDGTIKLYKNGRFPTGLLSIVRGILDKHGIPYEIYQHFKWPEKKYDWGLNANVVVRPRHVEAIKAILKGKRGMVQLPTRFGKTTVVASGVISSLGVPTLFIAHQLDLVHDARAVLGQFINGVGEVGFIGEGKAIYKPVTAACIDTLANKLKSDYTMQKYLAEKVQLVIVDETQFFGPGEYKDVLYACNAPHRLFMSATVDRMDGAELEIQAASGKMLYSLTEKEMIEEGYISDVNLEMIPFDHRLYNQRATGIKYHEFYDACIVNNLARNQVIVNEVCNLLCQGCPTLIIVRRIEHGHMLKEMLINMGVYRTEFVWGEISPLKRIELRNKFNSGELDVLIGSTVFDTAIDLHRASGLVLAASGSSRIRAPQRVGRVLSQVMGKTAIVKDIKDINVKYFEDDARDRQRVYIERYGDERVDIRNQREISDIERIFNIDTRSMWDNIL